MAKVTEATGADSGKTGNGDQDALTRLSYGAQIRRFRERAELTQGEAAAALGISDRTLRDWEKGRGSFWAGGRNGRVDYEAAQRMREVYGCRMSALLPRNSHPSAPLDPPLRRRWFWHANHMMQHNGRDGDGHVVRAVQPTDAELDQMEVDYRLSQPSNQRGEKQ